LCKSLPIQVLEHCQPKPDTVVG